MHFKPIFSFALFFTLSLFTSLAISNEDWRSDHYYALIGDFNGDGVTDRLLLAKKSGYPSVITLDGQDVVENEFWEFANPKRKLLLVGDFNDDGSDEVLVLARNLEGYALTLNEENVMVRRETSLKITGHDTDSSTEFNRLLRADFNNDDSDDFVAYDEVTHTFSIFHNKKSNDKKIKFKFRDSISLENTSVFHPLIKDFNGDGNDDIALLSENEEGMSYVALAKKNGRFKRSDFEDISSFLNGTDWSTENYSIVRWKAPNSSAQSLLRIPNEEWGEDEEGQIIDANGDVVNAEIDKSALMTSEEACEYLVFSPVDKSLTTSCGPDYSSTSLNQSSSFSNVTIQNGDDCTGGQTYSLPSDSIEDTIGFCDENEVPPQTPSSPPSASSTYVAANSSFTLSTSYYDDGIIYQFYQKVGNGSYQAIGSATGSSNSNPSFTATAPSSYGYVYYKYKRCRLSGLCSGFSPYKRINVYTAPGAPNNLSISPSSLFYGAKATLSWNQADGVISSGSYTVSEKEPGGSWRNILTKPAGTSSSHSVDVNLGREPGVWQYKVRACNPNNVGCGGSRTVDISVINRAPVADNESTAVSEGSSRSINVLSGDYDPDGHNLSITDWTQPSWGSVNCSGSNCTFVATNSISSNKSDSFKYTVSDGHGGTDQGTVNVTVTNLSEGTVAPPSISPSSRSFNGSLSVSMSTSTSGATIRYTTNGSTPTSSSSRYSGPFQITQTTTVKARAFKNDFNDSSVRTVAYTRNYRPNAEDDFVTVTEDGGASINVLNNDSDPDGHTINVISVGSPSHGTASISQFVSNHLTYTPDENFCGSDSFTYTVRDSSLTDTATIFVTVTCKNDPPTVSLGFPIPVEIDEDGETGALSLSLADPDANDPTSSLTISADSSNTGMLPVSNIVFGGGGANRTVNLTPQPNTHGTSEVTITVFDGTAETTATFDFEVRAINDPPVVNAGNDYYSTEHVNNRKLIGTANDVDGSSSNNTYQWTQISGPAVVNWSDKTSSTSKYRTPSISKDEVLVFRLTVTDDDGASGSDEVSVFLNDRPEFDHVAPIYSNTKLKSDAPMEIEVNNFRDSDETDGIQLARLRFKNVSAGSYFTDYIHMTLRDSNTRASFTYDDISVLDFQPNVRYRLITQIVDNDSNYKAPSQWKNNYFYVNAKPSITNVSAPTIEQGNSATITNSMISVSDVDDSSFSIALQAGANYTINNNEVIPHPSFSGVLDVGLKVSDGTELSDTYTFSLTVTPAAEVPKMSTPIADANDSDYIIAVSWAASSVPSVTKYNLQVQKNNGSWSNAYTGSSRSYQYNPTSDGIYTFRVRAYNPSGWGAFSDTESTDSAREPNAPSSITGNPATTTSGSFTVSWGAASYADSYQLEQKTNSDSWVRIYSGTSRSKSISLGDGVYRFRVRGKNTTGSYTSYGNFKYSNITKVAKTPGTPGAISGVPNNSTSGIFNLSWGAATGNVDYYYLSIEQDGVNDPSKIKVTSRSKSHQVTEDGAYRFKVEACNEVSEFVTCGGLRNSGYSTVQIVATPGAISTVTDQTVTSLGGDSLVSDLVGEIKGSSSVDGGAFNYSVPVTLPPGRQGMQPSISLDYSSQSGEGLAGYGWSVSASGAVHRCSEIYDLDGSTTSVLYDINDKLCINGKRLLKVTGTYGQAGATYQTERDPGFTVEQLGGHIGSNSAYFKVHYPNGNTETYGNSANSRKVRSGHSVAESWMLALSEDSFNNEVEYEYFGVTGNLYLDNIYYTGHNGTRGTRRVRFIYSTINGSEKFSFGGKSLSNRLLERIDIYIDGAVAANWRLEHTSPSNNGIYQLYKLDNLKYCDGASGSDCIQTDFDWYDASFAYSEGSNHPLEDITDQSLVGQTIYREGDYDDDGVPDLSGADGVYLSGGGFISWSSLPGYGSSGVGTPSGDTSLSNDIGEYRYTSVNGAIDFNGDGATDIIYKDSNDRIKIASYNSGNVSLLKDTGIDAGCYLSYLNLNTLAMCNNFVIDFDGDGRKDLLVATKAQTSNPSEGLITYKAYMNSGSDFAFAGQFDLNIKFSVNPIDVNGDGTPDLASATFGKNPWWYETNYNKSTGQLTFTHRSHTLNVNFNESFRTAPGKWIDFNGDGLPDILTLHHASSQHDFYTFSIAINKGNGSFASPVSTGKREFAYGSSLHDGVADENDSEGLVYNNFIKVFDFNGDGRQDLLVPTGTTGYRYQCWDHSTNQDCSAIDGAEWPRFHIYDAFTWDVWITQEDGVSFQVYDLGSDIIGALATMSVVDLNGDGRDDFVSGMGFESSATERRWYYGSKSGGIGSNPRGYFTYLRDATENYSVREVSTGMGVKAKLSYDQLANVSIPNNSFSLTEDHPYVRFTNTMRVVDTFEEGNGVGSFNTTQYRYGVPIFHLAGRGFQGFETIETIQSTPSMEVAGSNIDFKTTIEFEHTFPWSGMVKETQKEDITNNHLLSTTIYSRAEDVNPYTTGSPYCFYSPTTVNTSYGLNDDWISTTTTDIKKNALCQTTDKTIVQEDDYTTKTVTTDTEFYVSSHVSLPENTTVESRVSYSLSGLPSGERAVRKTTRYSVYDPSSYAVTESGVKNSAGAIKRKKIFSEFDEYGQPRKITEGTRWEQFVYSADGYFIENIRNKQWGSDVNASTTYFDKLTGVAETQIDANDIQTDSDINYLGQVLSTSVSKDSAMVAPTVYTQRVWNAGDYQAKVKTVQDGSPVVTVYLDTLGREARTETTGFDGSLIISETEFDERGNVLRTHTPTASYSTRASVEYGAYDALGRPESKSVDDGLVSYVSNYSYEGLITTITVDGTTLAEGESVSNIGSFTNSVGTMSRIYNSLGELLKTVDVKDGATYFAYDGGGNPDYIKDAKGSVITAVYDDLGQKRSFSDPNMGAWSFTYNSFGELETQTDARNVTIVPVYDDLGRVTEVSGREWFYDSAGKGLLDYTDSGTGEVKDYEYDSLFRVDKVTTTIDGINFVQEYAYHSTLGVLKAEKHPSNEVIGYEYNQYGYLEREYRHLLQADETLREIDETDAFGNIVKQVLSGNIYQNYYRYDNGSVMGICSGTSYSCGTQYQSMDYGYDGMGNLTHQHNLLTDLKEEYTYDNLMRVQATQYSRNGTTEANYDYDYDEVGNLTRKSDFADTYYYNSNRSEGGNAGPNAVRRVAKSSGDVYFSYDNNGNLLTGDGLTQAIYNVDNKPTKLIKNAVTTTFSYGADGTRFKQTKQSGGQTTTTYYIGKGFEREVQPGSKVLDKTYVGDHTTIYSEVSGNPSYPASVLHSLVDRLGSPSVLLTGGDSTPNIIRYRAHGIFGHPIDGGTGNKLINLADWDNFTRGYTGHEQLIEQQLIHMNGRVYDYNLGRFMSVDPFIQAPLSSQSINPYSYIMNNPMAGVDPTGYQAEMSDTEFDQMATDTQKAEQSQVDVVEERKVNHFGGRVKSTVKVKVGTATVSNGAVTSVQDLKGETVASVGKADSPKSGLLDLGESRLFNSPLDNAQNWLFDNIINPIPEIADSVSAAMNGDFSGAVESMVGIVGKKVKAVGKVGEAIGDSVTELTERVRHFTNNKGLVGIRESGIIKASDQNSVFTVKAKGKVGSARDIERQLGIKRGKAGNYVEFNAHPGEFKVIKNPVTGTTERVFKGNVDLTGRNASFNKNR